MSFNLVLYLSVTGIRHGFILVILESNMSERRIRNVLDVDPFHFELPLPLVLTPNGRGRLLKLNFKLNKYKINKN